MKRFLGITILSVYIIVASGQGTQNPFDLKYRPSQPKPTFEKPIVPADTPVIKHPEQDPVSHSRTSDSTDVKKTSILPTVRPVDSASTIATGNPFERMNEPDSTQATSGKGADSTVSSAQSHKVLPQAPKASSSRGFQIFFLLLSLLLLIFIVNVERSFVRDLWRVISNENYSSLHHRNQRNTMRQILLMMGYAVFILQGGLFLYHGLQLFGYPGTILGNIWTCIALVLCAYVIRHTVIRYLRWLFNNEKELTLFGFDISIFNTMVGLILLPLNILLIFGPENMYKPLVIIGLVAIGVAYLMRQLRWLLTANHLIANSLFLFFVYLCAVEILPLWAISAIFW